MEITIGNLEAAFEALKETYMDALDQVTMPDAARLLREETALTTTDQYPTSGLLGDLEEFLDELPFTDIWAFIQTATPILYAKGIYVYKKHIRDDQIGLYNTPIRQLAERAGTHAARHVADVLDDGFDSAWIDDANFFSNDHSWPGCGADATWDNLDTLPLTATSLEAVALHLMLRAGPSGEPIGLMPRLLVVGPHNRTRAQRILNRELVGGGNTNIHFEEMDLLVLPRLATLRPYAWFVVDDERPPILYDKREGPASVAQTSEESDEVFERERYRFKSSVEYVLAIMEPWRIQAVDWSATSTTTAGG